MNSMNMEFNVNRYSLILLSIELRLIIIELGFLRSPISSPSPKSVFRALV